MTLGPVTPTPISWQNTLVDIQPTSQYGRDFDRAVIMTHLLLQLPTDQDVDFLLPSIESPESAPVLRLVGEEVESIQELASAIFPSVPYWLSGSSLAITGRMIRSTD